jgi:ABC-2 type transport system permease protein
LNDSAIPAQAPVAARRASRLRQNYIGFTTILIREFGRIARIWGQTLVPPAVTATLYFIIFGGLIGPRVGTMGGYEYMQYIAPGLIMMSVITNAYGNVVSSFFGAKFGRYLEELLVSPLPNWLIVVGYVGGGILRGLLVGVAVTAVALVFTRLHVHHVWVIMSSVLLTATVFSLGGFIGAIFAKSYDQISWFPIFVLTPLTYFGGVFYSIQMLPDWAQVLSYANPILYMVNGFRYGFLGVSDVHVGLAYGIMLGATAIMYALAVTLLNRGTGIRE